jgi:beta-galactosidase
MKLPILLAALGMASCVANVSADSAQFPQADLMRIGVYYYPEAWPSNQWARDIANIKKLDLEFVHMGEFA